MASDAAPPAALARGVKEDAPPAGPLAPADARVKPELPHEEDPVTQGRPRSRQVNASGERPRVEALDRVQLDLGFDFRPEVPPPGAPADPRPRPRTPGPPDPRPRPAPRRSGGRRGRSRCGSRRCGRPWRG